MQAIQFKTFGPPEVLELVEMPIPVLAEDELLIKTYAAGINPIDGKIRDGSSFAAKQLTLPSGLGFDVCGKIVQSTATSPDLKIGDQVFGAVGRHNRPSSYAEFCVAKPADLVRKPQGLSPIHAAALPIAGLTAWQALHTVGQIQKKERVLIHAGAGGVGHLAVQLAKMANAYVIVTASQRHHVFLKQLGADEIIDYTQTSFEEQIKEIDLVVDLVGGETGMRSLSVLAPHGRLVTVPTITCDSILAEAKKRGLRAVGMLAEMSATELEYLAHLIAEHQLQMHIAVTFQLNEVVKAHQVLEQKHTQGKLVLVTSFAH